MVGRGCVTGPARPKFRHSIREEFRPESASPRLSKDPNQPPVAVRAGPATLAEGATVFGQIEREIVPIDVLAVAALF